jgi:ribosomal protein S18 acetylase RimI-like enzyme
MTEPSDLSFRVATLADAATVVALINSAYRGDSSRAGWTTEADLLEGARTDANEVSRLIKTEDSRMLLCLRDQEILGSVHLQKTSNGIYLGMFVVKPTLQGAGIGKQFMAAAEAYAKKAWNATRMWMTVITLRTELIAFYERRGYQRSGEVKAFPTEIGASAPLVSNLQLEVLVKDLA